MLNRYQVLNSIEGLCIMLVAINNSFVRMLNPGGGSNIYTPFSIATTLTCRGERKLLSLDCSTYPQSVLYNPVC